MKLREMSAFVAVFLGFMVAWCVAFIYFQNLEMAQLRQSLLESKWCVAECKNCSSRRWVEISKTEAVYTTESCPACSFGDPYIKTNKRKTK